MGFFLQPKSDSYCRVENRVTSNKIVQLALKHDLPYHSDRPMHKLTPYIYQITLKTKLLSSSHKIETHGISQVLSWSSLLSVALDVVNEAIGAGVMPTSRLVSLQLRLDDLGKLFTKLNTVCRHWTYESWEEGLHQLLLLQTTLSASGYILTPIDHRNWCPKSHPE